MNIAIVGGNGLVGNRLIEKFISLGHKVVAFVERMPMNASNECDYVVCDLSEYGSIARGLKNKNIEVLVHNAAISHPKLCYDNPYKMYHVNIDGTLNVMEACILSDVKRVIYISSGAVYGKGRMQSVCEDAKLYPISPYAASKIAGEGIVMNYGLDAIVLRLSCVYGPGRLMPEPINLLLTEAVVKEKIDWSEGCEQCYDYIYIDDCVDAIVKTTLSKKHTYSVYNVGGGEEVAYERIMAALLKKKPGLELNIGKGSLGYDNHGPFNISRMKEDFGWEPQVSIEEGVSLYYDYLAKE